MKLFLYSIHIALIIVYIMHLIYIGLLNCKNEWKYAINSPKHTKRSNTVL